MSDWSPEIELLSAIFDRLGEVGQAIAAIGGGKPRKLTPAPHPVTAMDRARNRRRQVQHRSLVARMLPKKKNQDQPPQ